MTFTDDEWGQLALVLRGCDGGYRGRWRPDDEGDTPGFLASIFLHERQSRGLADRVRNLSRDECVQIVKELERRDPNHRRS